MFKLDDVVAYRIGSELSGVVWDIVSRWKILAQKTLGEQWVRATDSIAGNIAEGFGRFHKKDKSKFYYNARASVYEAAHWTKMAKQRNLITDEEYEKIMGEFRKLPKEINTLIKLTFENLKK